MVIFHSYVKLPDGNLPTPFNPMLSPMPGVSKTTVTPSSGLSNAMAPSCR